MAAPLIPVFVHEAEGDWPPGAASRWWLHHSLAALPAPGGLAPARLWAASLPAHADLAAWQRGETGYPLVDAGMRELWTTGWMHNRVRMVVASFLTRHLLIDWREGARWRPTR